MSVNWSILWSVVFKDRIRKAREELSTAERAHDKATWLYFFFNPYSLIIIIIVIIIIITRTRSIDG